MRKEKKLMNKAAYKIKIISKKYKIYKKKKK